MKKYKLIVSEPWNFKGPFGDNTLYGKVVDHTESDLIFKSDKEISFKGHSGNILILSPSSRRQRFEMVDKKGSVLNFFIKLVIEGKKLETRTETLFVAIDLYLPKVYSLAMAKDKSNHEILFKGSLQELL